MALVNAELNVFLFIKRKFAQCYLTFHIFFCPDVDIDTSRIRMSAFMVRIGIIHQELAFCLCIVQYHFNQP